MMAIVYNLGKLVFIMSKRLRRRPHANTETKRILMEHFRERKPFDSCCKCGVFLHPKDRNTVLSSVSETPCLMYYLVSYARVEPAGKAWRIQPMWYGLLS